MTSSRSLLVVSNGHADNPLPLPDLPALSDKGKRPAVAAADDGDGGGRASKRPAAAAAGDGAGPSGAAGSSVPEPGQSSFTRLGLVQKTIKELQNVLKAWNLPVRASALLQQWGAAGASCGHLGAAARRMQQCGSGSSC